MRSASRTHLPRMGSEYSDEVTKTNKKEDLMLERKLRVLDRQERVAQSMVRKNIREIERLKSSIQDTASRSADLAHYDHQRHLASLARHGLNHQRPPPSSMKHLTHNPNNVRLPPLDGSKLSASQPGASSGGILRPADKEHIKRRNSLPLGTSSDGPTSLHTEESSTSLDNHN